MVVPEVVVVPMVVVVAMVVTVVVVSPGGPSLNDSRKLLRLNEPPSPLFTVTLKQLISTFIYFWATSPSKAIADVVYGWFPGDVATVVVVVVGVVVVGMVVVGVVGEGVLPSTMGRSPQSTS